MRVIEDLDAIANLKDRNRIRLAICGTVLDLRETSVLIDSLKLGEIVSLRGFLSDEDLDQMLACSDMALNLRYPSMGEASLSQLRIREHALPAIGYARRLVRNTARRRCLFRAAGT